MVKYFERALLCFAAAVIAISVVGWFVGDLPKGAGGLFILGSEGITYRSLAQILVFSLFQAGIGSLMFSNFMAKKFLLLWRVVAMTVLSFVSAVLFPVLFRWFPTESHEAWIGFILSLGTCTAICALALVLKVKLNDKKYQQLLSDYKANHHKERGAEQ